MPVSGVNNSGNNNPVYGPGTVSTCSGGPTLTTDSGTVQTTTTDIPTTDGGTTDSGSIPSPSDGNGPSFERGKYVKKQLDEIDALLKLKTKLEALASNGDTAAQKMLDQLDAADLESKQSDLQDEWDNFYGDLNVNWSADGLEASGDADGDGVTNAREDVIGTNAMLADSNADGITDKGVNEFLGTEEGQTILHTKFHDDVKALAASGDWNQDGKANKDDLPAYLHKSGIIVGDTSTGTTNSTGGTTGTDGATTATNLGWSSFTGAQNYDANTDQTVDVTGDISINLSGTVELSASENGQDLIVKEDGHTSTFHNAFDHRIKFTGDTTSLKYKGDVMSKLQATDGNHDGMADKGAYWTGGLITQSAGATEVAPDIFGGTMPLTDPQATDVDLEYNAAGASGVATLPISFKGKAITSWVMTKDGSGNPVLEGRGSPEGPAIMKIRLKGGETSVANFNIEFKLQSSGADAGQFFKTEMKCKVTGSDQRDFIEAGVGSSISGGAGADFLQVDITAISQAENGGSIDGSTLDGGDGNDMMQGSDGNDHMIGGAGMDDLNMGRGSDTADGGTGNDLIYGTVDFDATTGAVVPTGDTINGGAGNDASNEPDINQAATSIEHGIADLGGLVAWYQAQTDKADGALLDELIAKSSFLPTAQGAAAQSLETGNDLLMQRKQAEFEAIFGGPPIEPPATPPATPPTP